VLVKARIGVGGHLALHDLAIKGAVGELGRLVDEAGDAPESLVDSALVWNGSIQGTYLSKQHPIQKPTLTKTR